MDEQQDTSLTDDEIGSSTSESTDQPSVTDADQDDETDTSDSDTDGTDSDTDGTDT